LLKEKNINKGFAKNAGDYLIQQESGSFPAQIFRPPSPGNQKTVQAISTLPIKIP
jgi:hypothetical protein